MTYMMIAHCYQSTTKWNCSLPPSPQSLSCS